MTKLTAALLATADAQQIGYGLCDIAQAFRALADALEREEPKAAPKTYDDSDQLHGYVPMSSQPPAAFRATVQATMKDSAAAIERLAQAAPPWNIYGTAPPTPAAQGMTDEEIGREIAFAYLGSPLPKEAVISGWVRSVRRARELLVKPVKVDREKLAKAIYDRCARMDCALFPRASEVAADAALRELGLSS